VLRGLLSIEWKPEENHLYPASFKAMVRTLLLINERHRGFWLPQAIIFEVPFSSFPPFSLLLSPFPFPLPFPLPLPLLTFQVISWAALCWPVDPELEARVAAEQGKGKTDSGLGIIEAFKNALSFK
jgi:hypothetical protein